ncbi:septin-7 isoform X22 [Nilaparvata lugens]|uniref:septin-7 isoform X21 n=1 Tax=Nilaparvata lugens TaxID=108931 RepID=UPI00193D84C8|nr:septin-7 isoform X21 [Nilaparvata lugens]XP_039278253.1 septin-7 isoform X21 [Nilaparvata lugens]XP_039278254.1 septin-7 isoform X21 [Nilaparvata lugens]XP_039278255.1 septin-7 isoform X21 [Nilaparvata lugens]XP_039278256.1 septin-7 isoform X22 [Nilaparvata lugens]XP_039278257.1 septin-7 isoform X22 [Nilaparvata lugens]XP_039278258.1 septin-7 isoform X22 [Nilaparvata lugens]XP_039278260.1 septin-7 isoform X22 [Nilaparvata lugens]XP_039278261.1 septin-7 isoform X22 [Nilaparvata lugens]
MSSAMNPTTALSNGGVPAAKPAASPASYHYTSSASLLAAAAAPKPNPPPPTLPKYTTGSLSSASSATYRLASLDRLANRQRLFEQNSTAAATPPSSTIATDSVLQSKRELFFKNELPSAGGGGGGGAVPPVPAANPPPPAVPSPSAIKEALAKRAAATATIAPGAGGDRISENADTAERNNVTKGERDKIVPERKTKELDGYVGFANLPNQVYRKAVKKGFDFTLMVVGESGLGKSTLINSMFLADVYSAEHPGPSHRVKKTVQVETSKALLNENGVNLTLTVVDTPGFGDAVDNSNCWQPVIDYIESRYEEYLNAESRVNRKVQQPDSRVHCCLYFVAPSGHGLKPLDVEFMHRLHDKVNIIPIIAKADTMTPDEIGHFKKQILNEIAQHKIKIYEFPETVDEEEAKLHKTLRERVPFAVVGSNTTVEVDGKQVRGRKYPWGVAEVENLEHNDFIALRDMLISTHLQDLKDVTNNVHYENYRCRTLAGLGADGKPVRISNKNPLAQMEEEKRDHDAKMKKMETEMEQVFEMKVREKKQKLKDSEAELQKRHEQMRKSLEVQQKELEEKRKALEAEIAAWEQTSGVSMEELRRRSLERESVDGKEKNKKKKGLF